MLLIEINDIKELISQVGIHEFFRKLIENLRQDFANWQSFQKSSRHASYVPNGVLELMPVCGESRYSFKYVNGHPINTKFNRLNVVAFGALADVESGYPLMISEMTILTAIRTAAISALASLLLAKPKSKKLAIIGCGAQSEFQVLAHHAVFDLEEVHYFDLDPKAMQRFAANLKGESFKLIACNDAKSTITGQDIIITATAAKSKQKVIEFGWLVPGQHISGIGGDSPGKTELDPEILKHSKVVVEYFPQTVHEGEIQNLTDARAGTYAEIWEIISGQKPGRENANELTVFDDVGFALEDYSALRLVYDLAKQYGLGKTINLIPETLPDCKNLFGLLKE